MNPVAVLAVVAALSFTVPAAGDIVFKWLPATLSVLTGVEMENDLRYTNTGTPVPNIYVALQPIRPTLAERAPRTTLLAQAASAFDTAVQTNTPYAPTSPAVAKASHWWSIFVPVSIFASLLFIVGIMYSALQLMRIREKERAVFNVTEHPVAGGDITKAQLRWKKILEHANTENENDWRHAIIEADIMLDELLSVQGYHGDTVGDKLKQVERSDFNTIDLAWEAHKVRNRIAHEGSAHDLSAREVRRVIALYEQVLHEFHYI